ncbi:hypothetical protein [Nocardia stercoris]|uniref:Uncharacterized protein n=1 Tax=Nocardia stercoris TaxID=2483361 RepID=A0A3M2LCG2_9NOCA|nr:hypothetical protein [Nocardia stercoris]RMI35074.1 hypothetical protein EBN03_01740 [Nocardia stercoris]
MSTDDTPAPKPGPLANLIQEARNGSLTVSFGSDLTVNADEFAYIERDCQAFMDQIRSMQQIAKRISDQTYWGLGEKTDGLDSAKAVVSWFRGKAAIADPTRDTANNVWDILEQHYQIIKDIRDLHHTIAQKYVESDAEFAAEYNRIKANMPDSPIGPNNIPARVPTLGQSG